MLQPDAGGAAESDAGRALVEVLSDFAQTLLTDYSVRDILERLAYRVSDVLPVSGAGVMLEDGAGDLRFAAASDDLVFEIESLQIELGEGPCVAAYETGRRVLLEDLGECSEFPAFAPRALAAGLAAVFSFPMWRDDQRVGALNVYRTEPGALSDDELEAGQTLADVATVYLLNARNHERSKQAEEELRYRAFSDPLTKLPNRRLLLDHLDMALARNDRAGTVTGLVFLDLDRFKLVNDSLGHAAGDQLLVNVAARLQASIRPADTAARLGGDEFAVLCEGLQTADDALHIAERVLHALGEPMILERRELVITPSIGVAVTSKRIDDTAGLLAAADAAMYRAKESGRGRIELFDADFQQEALHRLETETAMRRAAGNDELRLQYQPVVDLTSMATIGAEALLRWQHPHRGLLPPGEFVGLAEETNLILPIGRWVLAEACRQAAAWRRLCPLPSGFQTSINLSPAQLGDPGLLEALRVALEENDLPAEAVCLEITEGMLVQDAHAATSMLHALKALGVSIAIDDFGTGYSSLAYLTQFPIDRLKVDQSFVNRITAGTSAASVVGAVVGLAHTLGMPAVAEGVENVEQLEALRRMGCDTAQGHLFSRSRPADEITDLLCSV